MIQENDEHERNRLKFLAGEVKTYQNLLIERILSSQPIREILAHYRYISDQYTNASTRLFCFYERPYDPTNNPNFFKDALLQAPFSPEHYCALFEVIYNNSKRFSYERAYKLTFIDILRKANARDGSSALHQLLKMGDLSALELIQMMDSKDNRIFPSVDDRLTALAHIVAHPAFDNIKHNQLNALFIPSQDEVSQASAETIALLKDALCLRSQRSFDETFDFLIQLQDNKDDAQKRSKAILTRADVVDIIATPLLSIPGLIDKAQDGCFSKKAGENGIKLNQKQLQLLYFKTFTVPETEVVTHARENLFPLISFRYTTLTTEEWRKGLTLCAQAADIPFFQTIIDQIEHRTLWSPGVHENVFSALPDPLDCLKISLNAHQREQQNKKRKRQKIHPVQDELSFRYAAACWDTKRIQAYADDPTRFRPAILDATLASMANSIATENVKNPDGTNTARNHSPESSAKIDCIKLLLGMGARIVTKGENSLKPFLKKNNCNSALKNQAFELLVEAYKSQTPEKAVIKKLNDFFVASENEEASRILHHHGANDFIKALSSASPYTLTFLSQHALERPSIAFERALLNGFINSRRAMMPSHHLQMIENNPAFVIRNFEQLVKTGDINPEVVTAIWNTMQPTLKNALDLERRDHNTQRKTKSFENPEFREKAEQLAKELKECFYVLDLEGARELIRTFPRLVAHKDYSIFNKNLLCEPSVTFLLKETQADVSPKKNAALIRFIAMCDEDMKEASHNEYDRVSCVREVISGSDIALRQPNEVWRHIKSMDREELERAFWKRIKTPLRRLLPPSQII